MGKKGEAGAGVMWRYFRGEVRRLLDGMSVPNTICFSLDGRLVYFSDSDIGVVMKQDLDADGWPAEDPTPFIDFAAEGKTPDGAVTDMNGQLWIAIWSTGELVCCDTEGRIVNTWNLPVENVTCPAFGGTDFSTLYLTSAWDWKKGPMNGQTFQLECGGIGKAEPKVELS